MADLLRFPDRPGGDCPVHSGGDPAHPGTLALLADMVWARRDGALLNGFLKIFLQDPALWRLAAEPRMLQPTFADGGVADAWLAAVAVHLCREHHWSIPPWALSADRVAPRPWFESDGPVLRTALLQESPAAFRERNLFVAPTVCCGIHPVCLPC